ncbi:MAG: hypothetical protein ACRD5H_15605, partial [Nitrososphaerales archaeon]
MINYEDKLVVAGSFDSAGGVLCNGIAAWDGHRWTPFGSGVIRKGKKITELATYNGNLIAGGNFDSIAGLVSTRIATWDGASWSPMGTGLNGDPTSLTVYQDRLVVTGYFTMAGGVAANRMAIWNGTSWDSFGNGTNSAATASIVHNGNLVIGGDFSSVDGHDIEKVAEWNGTIWLPFNNGLIITPYMAIYNLNQVDEKLYLVGRFVGPSNNVLYEHVVQKWDDTVWTPISQNGINNEVVEFSLFNKMLVAGGFIKHAGTTVTEKVAAWDGSAW